MNYNIKIEALYIDQDDGDLVTYKISAANDNTATSLAFYGFLDTFRQFAADLTQFPQTISDTVVFEIGEDNERWAYYLFIKAFCYEANGNSALRIKIDNHKKAPDTVKSEFFITATPASINNLGQLLLSWDPNTEKDIVWCPGRP